MTLKDLSEHSVRLKDAHHPEFNLRAAELQRRQRDDAFELLKPFSVLLKNDTQKTIVAYSVIWRFIGNDGRPGVAGATFMALGALLDGGAKRYTSDTTMYTIVRPGSSRLLSPLHNIGDDRTPNSPVPASSGQVVLRQLSQTTDLSVSVEAILFEDGTFVGPDPDNLIDTIQSRFDGEHDFYELISRAKQDKRTAEDILQEVGSIRSAYSQSPPADEYETARMLASEEFVTMSERMGFDQAVKIIEGRRFVNRPVIRRAE